MKQFLIILIFLTCGNLQAQTVTTTDGKTYTATIKAKQEAKPEQTGKTFIDSKGNSYPILKSQNGSFFVVRISAKTGKEYKQYLKLN